MLHPQARHTRLTTVLSILRWRGQAWPALLPASHDALKEIRRPVADGWRWRLRGSHARMLRRSTALLKLVAKACELLFVPAKRQREVVRGAQGKRPGLLVLHGQMGLLELVDLALDELHLIQLPSHCGNY